MQLCFWNLFYREVFSTKCFLQVLWRKLNIKVSMHRSRNLSSSKSCAFSWMLCSAVLAHFILHEKLQKIGILGCVMCIAGSVIIVVHAPEEHPITSVQEIWTMATQPGKRTSIPNGFICFISIHSFFLLTMLLLFFAAFLLYVASVVVLVFVLIFHFVPRCGHSNVLVFIGICSLMGSLSVNH